MIDLELAEKIIADGNAGHVLAMVRRELATASAAAEKYTDVAGRNQDPAWSWLAEYFRRLEELSLTAQSELGG